MLIENLYRKHKQELLRFAIAISKNGKEAEDAVQETFLRAAANAVTLHTLPDFKQRAWLYKVLKNIVYDRRRRKRFEIPLEERHEPKIEFNVPSGMEMKELLECLPPQLFHVVYQRYWLGMTSKQIAALQHIPAATVRYRLHVAIRLLRKKMESFYSGGH